MEEILLLSSVLAPVVLALVELVKRTINLKKNFIPMVSLVIGLLIGAAAYPFTDFDLAMRLWSGGLAGMAGTGLFELFKKNEGYTKQKDKRI
ncbi:holin [Virgibacillus phasianinus]|uniref:Holin n=1 Tax=Virgibacillus phasianinus TaxID=2017483 RepID=A0A220U1F3_9BACI|nr:holin [Virgibacillus phasianinus]ASK61907.1 holin [Virgibacillus phasianinus]